MFSERCICGCTRHVNAVMVGWVRGSRYGRVKGGVGLDVVTTLNEAREPLTDCRAGQWATAMHVLYTKSCL